jgi:hypothetical protein
MPVVLREMRSVLALGHAFYLGIPCTYLFLPNQGSKSFRSALSRLTAKPVNAYIKI